MAAREPIVMSAANCCPKPGYGATSKQHGKSGCYTGEVNACGEAHEASLGGSQHSITGRSATNLTKRILF